MNYFIQALGASLIAFPLILFFLAGRRHVVAAHQRARILIAGIILTACFCIALRYASQLLFGEFIVATPSGGLIAVFVLGAPLSFAFVVARLMRPLKSMPRAYQGSELDSPGQGEGEASPNLPTRR